MARNIVNETLYLPLTAMQFAGLYLYDKLPKIVFIIYTWLMHIIIAIPVPILSVVYLAAFRITDLYKISDNIFVTSETVVPIIKYLPMRLYGKKFKNLVERLNQPIFTSYLKEQEHYINDTINIVKKITKYYFTLVMSSCTTILITPIFSQSKDFPVEIWLPFNPRANKLVFSSIYFYIVLSG